jgi:hypothetical protein
MRRPPLPRLWLVRTGCAQWRVETVGRSCVETVLTRWLVAGYTSSLKCFRKSTLSMGSWTLASKNVELNQRPCKTRNKVALSRQGMCSPSAPVGAPCGRYHSVHGLASFFEGSDCGHSLTSLAALPVRWLRRGHRGDWGRQVVGVDGSHTANPVWIINSRKSFSIESIPICNHMFLNRIMNF